MHTIIVIAVGFLLLGICLSIGRAFGNIAWGALGFIPLWFIGAGINMWIGISRAGYSFNEELPVFLVIFLIPSVAASVTWWKRRG